MKTENTGIYLSKSHDIVEPIQPLWIFEAAELIYKIITGERFDPTHRIHASAEFNTKIKEFQDFESRIIKKGNDILKKYPEDIIKVIREHEKRSFDMNYIQCLANFYFYEEQGYIKNMKEIKRGFFSTFHSAESQDIEEIPFEDFETFYKIYSKEIEDAQKIARALHFHMHFEHYYLALKPLYLELAEMIKEEAQPLLALLPMTSLKTYLEQINYVFAKNSNSIIYALHHIFLGLVTPNGTSLFDNMVRKPICIVGAMSYELNMLEAEKKPIEWKTSILKTLGDPVRYNILLLSKDHPVYLTELANELGLKPSTVSHHLNSLVAEQLMVIDITDDKSSKTYFSPNTDTIKRLIQELEDIL